jgi:NADH-quinone oxidoreductase subunit C
MEVEPQEPGFLKSLVEKFGEDLTQVQSTALEVRATLALPRLIELLEFVKGDPAVALTYPANLTAVDDGENLTLLYRLTNLANRTSLLLHVPVSRKEPIAPTATGLWKGFDWHEREVFDMFGVKFEGHPDLRRILLPDEWEGFPFRKDYVSVPSGNPLEGPQPIDPVGGAQ